MGWLALHRVGINRGFLFRRHGLSTDTLFSLIIGCTATFWTIVILASASRNSDNGLWRFLSQASHAPWLVQILFIFWIFSTIDALSAQKRGYESFILWKLSVTAGPFEWMDSIKPLARWTLRGFLIITVLATSVPGISDGFVVQGVLNITGLVIFLLSGTTVNPYTQANHRYSADMLRIILPTSHHEGTVYILPSESHGFDAVWAPKVENEHLEADQQTMALFGRMRSGKWSLKEPLECIRHVVASYQERVMICDTQLELLARWLYYDQRNLAVDMRAIRCLRAPHIHLVGRDLMYALCHAEYLVFMGQNRLPLDLQQKVGSLRLMQRSGMSISSASLAGSECVGFKPGLEGYQEAVEYVYKLFDEPLDQAAIQFQCDPPKYSSALCKSLISIEEYVTELWDVSCKHSESTFTALYMFTLVWFMEVGACNGFHIFPLRCKNRQGDLVSQQIVWRQAWYCGVVCQLLSLSPFLFAGFIFGYLR